MKNLHEQADKLLQEIGRVGEHKLDTERYVESLLNGIRIKFEGELLALARRQGELEKKLRNLMKKNKNEFFAGDVDRLDLAHGSLLYKSKTVVKRIRKVTVDLLEKLGFGQAVKTVKSVNWDEIEKWPDVRLAEIGTERKPQEKFEYELPTAND